MAAGSSRMLLLAALVLGIFDEPCESQELRCWCVQTYSNFIHPIFFENIQLIPEGPHCSRKEVIVTLRNGKLVCLDPEAKWVMTTIKKIKDSATH